jgi:hypothetical protein
VSSPGPVDAVLLRRSRALRNVGIGLAAAGCAISFLMHGDMRLPWFIGLGTTGLVLALLGQDTGVSRVHALLEAGGVVVGDRLVAARSTIRSGWIERDYHGSRVHLDRGLFRDVEFEAADDAAARALLRAVACDPSQTVVKFPSPSPFAGLAGAMGGQLVAHAVFAGNGHLTAFLFAVGASIYLLLTLVVVVLSHHETSVGSDGILVSGLLRSQFVPFAEVEAAVVESAGKLVLYTRTRGRIARRMRGPAAEAAAELIQAAITSSHSGSEAVRQQLRRQHEREGDVGAWLARLRSLASHGPYRAVALGAEALWRVVDDPGATGAERAAAAVVLGTLATPAERARLRGAAARMACPKVRVAIERVADGAGPPEQGRQAGRAAATRAGRRRAETEAEEDELAVAMEAIVADSAA